MEGKETIFFPKQPKLCLKDKCVCCSSQFSRFTLVSNCSSSNYADVLLSFFQDNTNIDAAITCLVKSIMSLEEERSPNEPEGSVLVLPRFDYNVKEKGVSGCAGCSSFKPRHEHNDWRRLCSSLSVCFFPSEKSNATSILIQNMKSFFLLLRFFLEDIFSTNIRGIILYSETGFFIT